MAAGSDRNGQRNADEEESRAMFLLQLQNRWIKDLNLDFSYFVIWIGTIALILGRLTETMADPDLWGYMSFGRLFWSGAGFPYQDIFSYTPTKALWVYHEWLTGVIFYLIYNYLGPAGLQGLKYLIGLGTAALIYKTARIRGSSTQTSIICLLLISPFFSFAYSPVRAQVFTSLFFVLTLYILEQTKRANHTHYLWWLAPIFLLWANLHGGFISGLGMIGLFAIGESIAGQKARSYWLILAPVTLITLINPYGLEYWIYLKNALIMPRPDIDEWQSVLSALQNGEFLANNLMFIILFILAFFMLITSRTMNVSDILLLVVTSGLAFKHVRHQSLFFLIMGCYGPIYLARMWNMIRRSSTADGHWNKPIKGFTLILFLCLFFFYGGRFVTGQPFDLTLRNISDGHATDYNYPVGAVQFIQNNSIKGNILTEFSWGEYVIWSLPESRVAMDGRYETLYTEEAAREYFEFTKGGLGWREYLDKYPHEMILFRQQSVVSALLRTDPQWTPLYSDTDCILFIRKSSHCGGFSK